MKATDRDGRLQVSVNLLSIFALVLCAACSSDADEPHCEPMIQDGITANVDGAPFDLKCGIVVAGGSQSGEKLYAKAPEGMNIQMTSGVIDCSSHFRTGWPKGKHIDIGLWARDPGTYDGASATIWNVTGSHADGYPDLSATIVIDEVSDTSIRGSIDVNYYTTANAVGSFEVRKCF